MRKKVKKRSAVLLMALAVGLCIGSACKKESVEETPGTVTPVPGVNDDSGSQSGTEQTPGASVIYKEKKSRYSNSQNKNYYSRFDLTQKQQNYRNKKKEHKV